ncbi:MAG: hypothetical protein E6X17_08505 [Sporomusaceae bacterium]|nr:hypothetical protein [Sporomusaceae bacterium]
MERLLQQLVSEMSLLRRELAAVQAEMQLGFYRLDQKLGQGDERFDQLDQAFGQIDGRFRRKPKTPF